MMNDEMVTEKIIYYGRLHWVVFVKAVLILVVGLYIELCWGKWLGLPLIIAGAGWGILLFLEYLNASLEITREFITIQTGVLVRQTRKVSRHQLESLDITQTLMGSFFNYGCLIVRGTGGTSAFFNPIADPLTCRRFIETN